MIQDYDADSREYCEDCGEDMDLTYDKLTGLKLCWDCKHNVKRAFAQKKRSNGED